MRKKFDIVGLGSVLVDNLIVLPKFPKIDSKIEILKSQKQVGGPIPTSLRSLSSFGLRTTFIGKVGDDENAEFIKDSLFSSDVATSKIVTETQSKSGYANVWIDSSTGSRTIAYSSGTLTPMKKEDFDLTKLPLAKFLHLDGRNHDVALDFIKEYKKENSYISIDTGNYREKTLELLEHCDIIMMPKHFANDCVGQKTTQEQLIELKKIYPTSLLSIITDGKNGAVCMFQDKFFMQKAFDIETIDTTGAGDIHSAGILYGLYNNWKIEDTLEFAAASAALKCKHLGNLELALSQDVKHFIRAERTCKEVEVILGQ